MLIAKNDKLAAVPDNEMGWSWGWRMTPGCNENGGKLGERNERDFTKWGRRRTPVCCGVALRKQRRGCQGDVLVSRGAVAAVVGRLTSLGQDDRPTALSLLGALRPLCANSSLALRALHAAGGMFLLLSPFGRGQE